jgi:CheY-like chemotaxis protein
MKVDPLRILLADDDNDDCSFFRKALAALSISTELKIVNDGEQLMLELNSKESKIPDVLFLDLNMPRKTGLECLVEIKSDVRFKDLPVVIFSTSKDEVVMRKVFKAGVHVYIRKPGDFGQLKEVINNALPIASEKIFSTSSVKYILNA